MHAPNFLISGASPIYRSGLLNILGQAPACGPTLQLLVAADQPTYQQIERLRRQIRSEHRTLLLGGPVHPSHLNKLLSAGLNGYLLRDAAPEKLWAAIETVYRGGVYIDPDLRSGAPALRAPVDPLTKRERQVLRLIVLEHTTEEIAGKLFISRCTVETHRAHILQKLGVRNTAGIVREAIRRELCAI